MTLLALASPRSAQADKAFDHARTSFPLIGRHQKVACESCHPAAGATRKWAGVPTDCHGCHGDRANHKGALGAQCQLCHEVAGWKLVKHAPAQHHLALVGNHHLECVSCHAGGGHLAPAQVCGDCHVQPHGGTRAGCTTCHNLGGWKSVAFAGHTYEPELLPGKHRAAKCLGCHPAFHFAGMTVQCESCHKKDQPHEELAGACKTCHPSRGLTWKKVTLEHSTAAHPPSLYQVAKFDHVAHAQKVTTHGLSPQCATCHAGLDFTKRPSMQACESCHDGRGEGKGKPEESVFDARGTQCGRCHQVPAGRLPTTLALAPPPATPPKPFSHEDHAKLKVNVDDCRACHGAGIEWQKVQAGRDQHRPCQGCHAAEFRKIGQPICLGCHLRSDPFPPNPLRPPAELGVEWRGASLPHAPHLAAPLACVACHPAQAGLSPLTHPTTTGHALCARCHTDRAALTLERCTGCHVLASAPRRARPDRPWSTRDRFHHDATHRAPGCESCHRGLAPAAPAAPGEPARAQPMDLPTMTDCAACHDGAKAFKVTGFGCARCHSGAALGSAREALQITREPAYNNGS